MVENRRKVEVEVVFEDPHRIAETPERKLIEAVICQALSDIYLRPTTQSAITVEEKVSSFQWLLSNNKHPWSLHWCLLNIMTDDAKVDGMLQKIREKVLADFPKAQALCA